MKKVIFALVFIFQMNHVKAQITFPAKGADWHYETISGGFIGPTTYSNTEIKYSKDSILMGKNAKVLSATSIFRFPAAYNSEQYIYVSNDSVFFFNSQTLNKWQLLYSFHTPVGQSWQIHLQDFNYNLNIDTITVTIDSIKYTTINSTSLKTMYVNYTGNRQVSGHSVIYDRIGDIGYLFNFTSFNWALCDGCESISGLLCYRDSSFSLYQPDTSKSCNYDVSGIQDFSKAQNQVTLYPNPNTGSFFIEANGLCGQTVQVYDIAGKLVLSQVLQEKTYIEASDLKEGVYCVSVISKDVIRNKRLIIMR